MRGKRFQCGGGRAVRRLIWLSKQNIKGRLKCGLLIMPPSSAKPRTAACGGKGEIAGECDDYVLARAQRVARTGVEQEGDASQFRQCDAAPDHG